MDWLALALAVGLCLAMGAAEGALTGKELPRWLASLKRPPLFAPLWAWALAALATYAIQGVIAYRLIAAPHSWIGAIALAALVAVMAANVGYNVVLARRRSPRFAYTGILWFLPPLALLQIALLAADPFGAALNAVYLAWVIGYDLPVMRALWQRNL